MQGCGNKYLWSLKTPPTDDEDGACPPPPPHFTNAVAIFEE